MAQQSSTDVIKRYLDDVIAAERHFENQLRDYAKDVEEGNIKQLFTEHAEQTKTQHERLTRRLEALGGSPSGLKSFMANLLGFAPKTAQMGREAAEKGTQDLVMAYAVEHSEIALYEAFACACAAGGDTETESLAREIQEEERRAAERVWDLIPGTARTAFSKVVGGAEDRKAA